MLIKSKQDELKNLQPLKPFQPFKDALGVPVKNQMQHPLNPKQLIQKYQLDRSQLAFTFCKFSSDEQSSSEQWDTTVYSTVLTGKKKLKISINHIKKTFFFISRNATGKFETKINRMSALYPSIFSAN